MGSGGSALDDIGNVALNIGTLGLVGWEAGRGFRTGGTIHALDEGLGEITGRNLAREQMAKAEKAAAEEKVQREVDRQNENRSRELEDISASRAAAALRSGSQGYAPSPVMKIGNASGDEKDFLGL